MQDFHNLIKPRTPRMLKIWRPWIPFKMEKYLTPEELKFKVLSSPRIRRIIEEVAKGKENEKAVRAQVLELLVEIGFSRSLPIIRILGIILSAIMTRIYTGIQVNMASVTRLKGITQNSPVLYLPCHRSYADFILMSYVCYSCDIEIPGIAAGMDFFRMTGVGEMLRKTGAFFLRRSFSSDKLYWYTFKEYIHSLMTSYHSGVEFFLEGTRSRSNKSLPPKIGLLSMALEPLFSGEVPDVTIVPVSIAYEKPLEEQLFVYELLGVPKPKESTRGLFKALSILNENFGAIYFEYGEPISVKMHLGSELDRFKHALEPAHTQELDRHELATITSLAYDVIWHQQQRIVITTFNLVAFTFNYRKFKAQRFDPQDVDNLTKLLTELGALVNVDSIEESLTIHLNLFKQSELEKLELVGSKETFLNVDTTKMKAHKLSPKIMSMSVPIFTLQLYINPILHWIAPGAIVLLVLKVHASDAKPAFDKLRDLLALEFVFRPRKVGFEAVWNDLKRIGIIDANGIVLKENDSDLFISILVPFILCYLHVTTVIQALADDEFEEKVILCKTQELVEKLIAEKSRNVHPYCLSLDSISIAVQSLAAVGSLIRLKNETTTKYRKVTDSLEETHDLLQDYSSAFIGFDLLYNQNWPKAKL